MVIKNHMKDLLLKHYELIKKRGLITPETTADQFLLKMEEEWLEVLSAYADDLTAGCSPSSDYIHECTDLVMTIMNMFQHYGIDFKDELIKNIAIQKNRIKQ